MHIRSPVWISSFDMIFFSKPLSNSSSGRYHIALIRLLFWQCFTVRGLNHRSRFTGFNKISRNWDENRNCSDWKIKKIGSTMEIILLNFISVAIWSFGGYFNSEDVGFQINSGRIGIPTISFVDLETELWRIFAFGLGLNLE